jgi:sialic acid synthase SpsE
MENTKDFYQSLTNNEPFIIAEIGSNHMGNMETAKKLIDAAKQAGCDAVKFQSWKWDTLESKSALKTRKDYTAPGFSEVGLEAIKKKLALTQEQHKELKEYCDLKEIIFSSSPYDKETADMLVDLGVPFIKIASTDVIYHDLLKHVASKGLPMIISTGMCTLEEIDEAVSIVKGAGNNQIVLLHCVAEYPTSEENVNLKNITLLQERYQLPVGFSDHSLSTSIPAAAVALGAKVIEKHFMLDNQECREQKVSLPTSQMKLLVQAAHQVAHSLGSKERIISQAEEKARIKMRRSVVTSATLSAGHVLTLSDLEIKRPGNGIPPKEINGLIGKTLKNDKGEGDLILREELE